MTYLHGHSSANGCGRDLRRENRHGTGLRSDTQTEEESTDEEMPPAVRHGAPCERDENEHKCRRWR